MKQVKAGLFGLGVVGSGVYEVLLQNKNYGITIEKIAVKNLNKQRSLKLPAGILTSDAHEILDDNTLDIVIELINDAEEAFEIVKKAFSKGKSVVSANKKMIALHLQEILDLRQKHGVKFFYEGAVCGSIPILRLLEQHYRADRVRTIETVANGTCNFILSKMTAEKQKYEIALKQAQQLGFAELDPHSDVSGKDTRFKLSIMIYHAFHTFLHPDQIPLQGIDYLGNEVIEFAQSHKLNLKLIGKASNLNGKIDACVSPQFVDQSHDFNRIENEYNGVLISSEYTGVQFIKGKGAGRLPTALAVISNLADIKYNLAIAKAYRKTKTHNSELAAEELYFIGGYDNHRALQLHQIVASGNRYLIAKSTFSTLQKFKQEHQNLYWVKIPVKVYEKISKHEEMI